MKIKLNKTYITRAGDKVKIIYTDRKSEDGTSIIGLLTLDDNSELVMLLK